jgi:hypothetical protein
MLALDREHGMQLECDSVYILVNVVTQFKKWLGAGGACCGVDSVQDWGQCFGQVGTSLWVLQSHT